LAASQTARETALINRRSVCEGKKKSCNASSARLMSFGEAARVGTTATTIQRTLITAGTTINATMIGSMMTDPMMTDPMMTDPMIADRVIQIAVGISEIEALSD
jgi:hypothetical protein